jgi:integrase
VSVYRRSAGGSFHVEVEWRDFPRLRLSTGTTSKARAQAMERTLRQLKAGNRRDLLGLLKAGRLRLADVHSDMQRGDQEGLQRLAARVAALETGPELGTLTDEWFAWLGSHGALSRSHRPFALRTISRYRQSWARIFAVLPLGRAGRLASLTRGFLLDYRANRIGAGAAPATVNRDLSAVGAFWTWCAAERGLPVQRAELPKEREPAGRERWLSADELVALEAALPAPWWPFFALLAYTGLRLGEAQGLLWADVRLADQRIRVSDRTRRLKTPGSTREVPMPTRLAGLLAQQRIAVPSGPADTVFPGMYQVYHRVRATFRRAAFEAGLHDGGRNESGRPLPNVTIHDLRHTFGVHAAQSGVPIARLQKLLGHASPHMTLRYMQHAPESYMAEDGAKIGASLSGERNREADAQAALARAAMRPA